MEINIVWYTILCVIAGAGLSVIAQTIWKEL